MGKNPIIPLVLHATRAMIDQIKNEGNRNKLEECDHLVIKYWDSIIISHSLSNGLDRWKLIAKIINKSNCLSYTHSYRCLI